MLRKFICKHGLVTDSWVSLDPANEEIIQGVYKKNIREGEERLMLAVLESAVEDFQKYVLARNPSGNAEAAESPAHSNLVEAVQQGTAASASFSLI
jgi:hypothetical protein